MGGCATKPKVLKGNVPRDDVAPAPIPAPSNSPPAPIQKEEVMVKEAVVENDAKESVPVVVDHNSATKNSSLGNLFKENQEGKDSDEKEKETVKVADVSETTNTPKEVEKTIHEDSDSSLQKNNSASEKEEEKVEAEADEVTVEIAENKKPDEVTTMVNVVTPEEQNLDHIKPKIIDPEEKNVEEKLEIPQKQEEVEEEEEESMKQNPPPPPLAPASTFVDEEKFSTPKEKPVETNAIPKVVEMEVEVKEEEEEKKEKTEENNAIPKVVEMEVEEDKKEKPEEVKQKILN